MRPLLILLAMAVATPAAAQERTPELREALAGLARAMGESQALRQVCMGDDDRRWRDRLADMLDTEQPDEAFAKRLKDSFGVGVAAARAAHPDCSPAARQAQAQVARRGHALAAQLAVARRRVPGWQPSLPEDNAEQVTPDTSPG